MRVVDLLKVDKDCFVDQEWLDNYVKTITAICERFGVIVQKIQMCPSRMKGLHFYISITPPVMGAFANQLQWLIGDDSRRVDFNRARIASGLEEWNKLFELPNQLLQTIYQRVPEA